MVLRAKWQQLGPPRSGKGFWSTFLAYLTPSGCTFVFSVKGRVLLVYSGERGLLSLEPIHAA